MKLWRVKNSNGFTLTELLIAVSIVILLLLLLLLGLKIQITRGYDARRKTDLAAIKRAFEEYYTDHGCYPAAGILDNCGGAQLQPYLKAIPCDPVTKAPYKYVPKDGDPCKGYNACVGLGDTGDRDITSMGCNPITGCGWGEGFNYCISSGGSITAPGFNPNVTPIPTPTPTPAIGHFACDPAGQCNSYADPVASGCPMSFFESNCQNRCAGNPGIWCLQ